MSLDHIPIPRFGVDPTPRLAQLQGAVGRVGRRAARLAEGERPDPRVEDRAWLGERDRGASLMDPIVIRRDEIERRLRTLGFDGLPGLEGALRATSSGAEARELVDRTGAPEGVRLCLLLAWAPIIDRVVVADVEAALARGLAGEAGDRLPRLVASRPELRIGIHDLGTIVLRDETMAQSRRARPLLDLRSLERPALRGAADLLVGRGGAAGDLPDWVDTVRSLVANTLETRGCHPLTVRGIERWMRERRENPFTLDGWRLLAASDAALASELWLRLGPELWPGVERSDLAGLLAAAPRAMRLELMQRLGTLGTAPVGARR